jgi:hypothetical protein
MKRHLVLVSTILLSANVSAQCIGSGAMKSCSDAYGNNYTVNKIGNTTFVNGSNANGNWSSTSIKMGNTVMQSGTDIDGNSWNQTIYSQPGGMSVFGTDSDGDSFGTVCDEFGCY